MLYENLQDFDPEIDRIIQNEEQRQRESLNLIASENFTSVSVLQANGSVLTNKYSEGQVGRRYYGGNENIDKIEAICKERALALFGLDPEVWGVNVQTLSGCAANIAVYLALAGKNGRIMGLDLPSGGHLSHGYQTPRRQVSATSVFFKSRAYRCTADGVIDYDALEREAGLFAPDILICGGSAYPREFDYARLRKIAGDGFLMMDMAHVSGLIAAGVMKNPFEYADVVTTTTHKVLRGPRSGMIFYRISKTRSVDGKKVLVDVKGAIESAVFPGLQGGPHNQKIAALAVALKQAASEEYRKYAHQVVCNAQAMCSELQRLGHRLLTGGTDCHLLLICLDGIGGAEVERLCELVNITVNKNCIVSDKSPLAPSAVRLGTPALTTRGFKEADIVQVVHLLCEAMEIAKEIRASSLDEAGKCVLTRFEEIARGDARVARLREKVIGMASKFDAPCFNYRKN